MISFDQSISIAFTDGAQVMREMLARFVEQGGDATTAASIRANWNPQWGDDPGTPPDEDYRRGMSVIDPSEYE